MRRRRSRVSVRVDPNILEPREQPLHEIAAAMAALRPPSTSAHDTDQETPCCVCGGGCEPRTPHLPIRRSARLPSTAPPHDTQRS